LPDTFFLFRGSLYIKIYFPAIETEKSQQNLMEGIESFDPKKLKHTETQEKNPLPTKEGAF
jgi:hypothetical protein